MGTPTNLFMNWDAVTVTYGTTPTVIQIGEVLDIKVDKKSVQEIFFGDNRKFARFIRNVAKTRELEIMGGNVAALALIPEDTPCVISGILNDVANGHGSGAITVTLSNAVCKSNPFSGQNNKFAGGSVHFAAFGDATDTDPLSISVAA